MSAAAYFPIHGSLEERVIEWLRKNPDEELQRSDVASKFNVAQTSVAAGLANAVARGELEWVKPAPQLAGVYRLAGGWVKVPVPPPAPALVMAPAAIKASAKVFGKRLGDEALDISVQVTETRHLTVAFVLPPEADAHLVAAAMLTAAAHSMERVQVVAPKP